MGHFFHLTTKIPDRCAVAVSGGVDSMVALDFIRRKQKRQVYAAMFDHGSGFHATAYPVVQEYCQRHSIELRVGEAERERLPRESREEYWRNIRYGFLDSLDMPVVLGHHLDDVAETWLFSACHGEARLIPSQRDQYLRPFLTVRRFEFLAYAERHAIPFVDDPSNMDETLMRNYIRRSMMENALLVNPGLHEMLKRKILRG